MTDDLISRKTAIEWINKMFCEPCKEKRDLYGGVVCRACLIDDAIGAIETAPTVDAVPVRHGKWIDETFEPWGLVHHPFKCNICGEHAEYSSPYCPNCGADMRGN